MAAITSRTQKKPRRGEFVGAEVHPDWPFGGRAGITLHDAGGSGAAVRRSDD
jgi:hypothetical protein